MNTIACILLIALYGALMGAVIRKLVKGLNKDLIACTIIAAVGGVALGAFGPSMDLTPFASACTIALSIGSLLVGVSFARASLRRSMMMAPAIREFALANFDRLAGGDGTISRVDLMLVLDEGTLTDSERKLADRMMWDLPIIGHVIDTHVAIAPHGGMAATFSVYGASRSDLESYPQRVAAEFQREYGTV